MAASKTFDSKTLSKIFNRLPKEKWNEFKKIVLFDNKVKFCLEDLNIRGELDFWINETESRRYQKNANQSQRFRLAGNQLFGQHKNTESLAYYTKSLLYAPPDTEEFALALANRSAVLFSFKKYKECLVDIDLALEHNYPINLTYKILYRKTLCFARLGMMEEAITTAGLTVESFRDTEDLTEMKKESMLKDMTELAVDLELVSNLKPRREKLVPGVSYPSNPKIPHASGALEVRFTSEKGRYVVTNQPIRPGDVLFVEKPYSSVLLPEFTESHCDYCYRKFFVPYPCVQCTEVWYCSVQCRDDSHSSYHRYECQGVHLLQSTGIAYLALRTVLVTALRVLLGQKNCSTKTSGFLECAHHDGSYGSKTNIYKTVYHLIEHTDKMEAEDLFLYSTTAALLVYYLFKKTHFFSKREKDRETEEEVNSVEEIPDEVFHVGGLLLRHVAQLVSNAHAITEICSTTEMRSDGRNVEREEQVKIATAIYPSASLMNHSCDPTVINGFVDDVLVVRAIKSAPKNGEIFNCYGPHFQRMPTTTRQVALQQQYFFKCTCKACRDPSLADFQSRFSSLKCTHCEGPVLDPDYKHGATHSQCMDCGFIQKCPGQVDKAFKAHRLFRQALEYEADGSINVAIKFLEECLSLQQEIMYKHNQDICTTRDVLAKCYAFLGHFEKSAACLRSNLPALQERYGDNSIEIAHELNKFTDVLIGILQDDVDTFLYSKINEEALGYLKRAVEIFSINYGSDCEQVLELEEKKTLLKS